MSATKQYYERSNNTIEEDAVVELLPIFEELGLNHIISTKKNPLWKCF